VKKFFDGKIPNIDLSEADKSVVAEINAELKEYIDMLESARYKNTRVKSVLL